MSRYGQCVNHPNRNAKRRCFRCHKAICPECQAKSHGHVYCVTGCAQESERERYLDRIKVGVELDKHYGIQPGERAQLAKHAKRGKKEKKIVDLSAGDAPQSVITVTPAVSAMPSPPVEAPVPALPPPAPVQAAPVEPVPAKPADAPTPTPPSPEPVKPKPLEAPVPAAPVARSEKPNVAAPVSPSAPKARMPRRAVTKSDRSWATPLMTLATVAQLTLIAALYLSNQKLAERLEKIEHRLSTLESRTAPEGLGEAPTPLPPVETARMATPQPEWRFDFPGFAPLREGEVSIPLEVTMDGVPAKAEARFHINGMPSPWSLLEEGRAQWPATLKAGPHYMQAEVRVGDGPPVFSPARQVVVQPKQAATAPKPKATPPAAEAAGTIDPALASELPMEDIARGEESLPYLALTFDGGSDSNISAEILDILEQNQIRTTFFLTGEFIRKYPDLTNRIVAEGHEVGNHSWDHPHLTSWATERRQRTLPGVTREFIQQQLLRTARAFKEATGREMAPLWRAPYGEINDEISGWAQELGWRHVAWTTNPQMKMTLDTHDWVVDQNDRLYQTAEEIKDRLLAFAEKDRNGLRGGIILMHMGTQRKIDQAHTMLESLIDELRGRGYEFAKVSQLMMAR